MLILVVSNDDSSDIHTVNLLDLMFNVLVSQYIVCTYIRSGCSVFPGGVKFNVNHCFNFGDKYNIN